MAEPSTIFIPDISGYTQFMSRSELDHNAFILGQMIECIIECNSPNFIVSEVEGDAVLFYKIGPVVEFKDMVAHCLDMHRRFHERLMEMALEATCQCHACGELIQLKLKFVIHYGEIREVQMAHFKKASGMDMIIAHRLLKNDIPADEYILATDKYLDQFTTLEDDAGLLWKQSTATFSSIGDVGYKYASIGAPA